MKTRYKEKFRNAGSILVSVLIVLNLVTGCDGDGHEADAYGNFESRETIVSAEVPGKILKLTIDEGQILKKNTVVGKIDSTQTWLKLEQLKAQKKVIAAKLASVDANIAVLQTQQKNAKTELDRVKKLFEKKAATQQQYDQVSGSYDVIIDQITSAQVQKQSVYAEMQTLDVQIQMVVDQLQKCKVVNPISGTVLEKYVEENELVGAGKAIYKIANLNTLDLRVYVSGSQLSNLKIGNKAKVFIDTNSEEMKELEGTITWISGDAEFTPKIIQTKEERVKLVYAVKIKVTNDGSLKIGMPGEVVFSEN